MQLFTDNKLKQSPHVCNNLIENYTILHGLVEISLAGVITTNFSPGPWLSVMITMSLNDIYGLFSFKFLEGVSLAR